MSCIFLLSVARCSAALSLYQLRQNLLHPDILDPLLGPPHSRHRVYREDADKLSRAAPDRVDLGNCDYPWILWTDEHRAYPKALRKVPEFRHALQTRAVCHSTVSSRKVRNGKNLLFPVNYIDREIRKDMGDHARETVKHAREMNMSMQRLIIMLGAHTFDKPIRITGRSNTEKEMTHADAAGLTDAAEVQNLLGRRYTYRHCYSHADLKGCPGWIGDIWRERYSNPKVVDSRTGEELTRRTPGNSICAGHLRA